VALRHFALAEIDFGEDAQAADNPGDRVPVHLNQLAFLGGFAVTGRSNRRH
jgi:hypothetical protein